MKNNCRAIKIENSGDIKELYKSIKQEYNTNTVVDDRKVIISTDRNSNILKEWISISSFLWKNSIPKLRMIKLDYPITIHKNE